MLRCLAALTGALAIGAAVTAAQAPPATLPDGISRTVLLDNAAISVARVRFAPGARETVHTHPFTLALVQLTRGDQEFLRDTTRRREVVEAGAVEIVEPNVPHAAANVGTTEWEVIAVGGKRAEPDLAALGPAMLTPARPELAPEGAVGARIIIPLSVARLQVRIGDETTTELYAAGEPIFVPRDATFALRSTGTAPVAIVSLLVR